MLFSTGHESKSGEGVGVMAFACGWRLAAEAAPGGLPDGCRYARLRGLGREHQRSPDP